MNGATVSVDGPDRTVLDYGINLIESNCDSLDRCTGNREEGKFHDIVYRQNLDGSIWDKFDNFVIDDEGTIIEHSQFAGKTTGEGFKRELLKINYQQIITASEFQGRKIDLVVAPKILIESGLIP